MVLNSFNIKKNLDLPKMLLQLNILKIIDDDDDDDDHHHHHHHHQKKRNFAKSDQYHDVRSN